MPDKQEYRSLIDAAEKAAAAGDYTSAEQLLRSGAVLQEAELGPLDPTLANTLNNLGVVCEIVDKADDAGLFYQRAYEIASAVLASDHPFVATSRQNLSDFYRVRGRTLHSPVAPPPVPPAVPPVATLEREPEIERVPQPLPERAVPLAQKQPSPIELPRRPASVKRSSRPLAVGVLTLCALVVLVWFVTRPGSPSNEPSQPSPIDAAPSVPERAAPAPAAVEPAAPRPAPEVATNALPATKEESRVRLPKARGVPEVASAQLCKALSTQGSGDNWQCTPPSRPSETGWLSFYTRVKSPKDTTVEHRWYLGDHLYQVVELRVQANQGSGYRTYSRYNMKAESAGNWKVEVRSEDGMLLHEERFAVR